MEEVNQSNVETVVFIFKKHKANAKGLIKDLLNCTDKQYLQIESNYNFNGYKHLIKPKPRKPRLTKFIKLLKTQGIMIDEDAKSIAIPKRELTEEEEEAVGKLMDRGFLIQQGIY